MLGSFVFVILALIEFGFVVYLKQTFPKMRVKFGRKEKARKIEPRNTEAPKNLEHSLAVLRNRQFWRKEHQLETFNAEEEHQTQKFLFDFLPLQTIDLISFWVFLFLYFMFNCIYWAIFLM